MLKIIVKQPNGKHALYNFDANCFELINKTIPQIRKNLIDRAAARIESDIICFFKSRSSKISKSKDPSFEAFVENIKEEHGQDEITLCSLRQQGILV